MKRKELILMSRNCLMTLALMTSTTVAAQQPNRSRFQREAFQTDAPMVHDPVYDQLVGYKVFDEMKKYHGDVMIVYGDKDPIAAGDYMERARKVYRSCEVNVVPDGAHGFPQSITHVKANDYIVKFLRRKML